MRDKNVNDNRRTVLVLQPVYSTILDNDVVCTK
jgi:hypothetical protein